MNSEFKKTHSLEERRKECEKMRTKFADRVPVIVERVVNSDLPQLDRKKFLVPKDIIFGQFLSIIRKRVNISSSTAIFTFVGDNQAMTVSSATMNQTYEENKDEDGFLYVFYTGEDTFGSF